MRRIPGLRRFFRIGSVRPDPKGDVKAELEFHFQQTVEDLIRGGYTRDAAVEEAHKRFGDFESYRRELQRISSKRAAKDRRTEWSYTLLQDLKVAVRRLRRTPAFTFAAFATLVLGMGSLATIYTVLDSVVLEDLPYHRAEDLVDIYSSVPGLGFERWEVTEAGYLYFSENSRTLDALGAYRVGSLTVEREDGAERVTGTQVTPSLLTVLGARPASGRLLGGSDVVARAPRPAIMHHEYWVAQYGADPSVIGSSIRANGVDFEIVGVLSPGFDLPEDHADLWLPLRTDAADPDADSHSLRVIGRRADGAPVARVQAELTRLTAQFPERFPEGYTDTWIRESGFHTVVQDLSAKVVGADVQRVLWILFGASAMILLIAGANVLNLFLIRNIDRQRELAVRSALGAERSSIFRHFAVEALLMTFLACAAALGLAQLSLVPLKQFGQSALPRLESVGIDASIVGVALLLALVAGLALGGMPVLSFREREAREAVTGGGTRTTGGRRQRAMRAALVAGQLALALLLLNGSGLLVRSFRQLLNVDPGFRPHGVVAVDFAVTGSRYRDQESVDGFYRDVLRRVRAIPGVVDAGAVTSLPLETGLGCYSLAVESRPLADGEPAPCIDVHVATPGYFEAMGVTLADGRWFTESDNTSPTGAVIVTGTLAERLWPGSRAIAQGVSIHGYREPWFPVAGVTGPLLANGLDEPPSTAVFFPMVSPEGARRFLAHRSGMTLIARTTLEGPLQHVGAIRRAVAEVDPTIAVANPRLVDEVVAAARSDMALAALLLGLGAAIALILGTVGLYGVMAHRVRSQTSEIGVRIALGATASNISRLVLSASLKTIAIGVVIGVVGSWASAGVLRKLLFGIGPIDPVTLVAVSILLAGVATGATVLVVRRAVAVDPVEALRAE